MSQWIKSHITSNDTTVFIISMLVTMIIAIAVIR
jgi:hypothetical protein